MIISNKGKVNMEGSVADVKADALSIFVALYKQDWFEDVMNLFITMLAEDHPIFKTEPLWKKEWRMEDEEDEEDDDEFY